MGTGIRRRLTSVHVVVWSTVGIALLSIATGLVATAVGHQGGVYGGLVPPVIRQIASYTGTIVGFLLLIAAVGLNRGFRSAWYATVILLPLTLIHGLLQSSLYSFPLVFASFVMIPTLLLVRGRFKRTIKLTTSQVAAVVAVFGTQLYGTVGAYSLRGSFTHLSTWFDAFYFTLLSSSTIGFGNVQPSSTSLVARVFTMTVIIFGAGSFAAAFGVIFVPIVQNSLANALGRSPNTNIDFMQDHLLVLGYGRLLTESVLDELNGHTEYVLVVNDLELANDLRERNRTVVHGDPSDEDVLRRVGIDRARSVLAATTDDSDDALAVLTARQLNPRVRIVAAATDRENVAKLRHAGANTVVSPALIGRLLVDAALGREHVEELADQLSGEPVNRTLDEF